MELPWEKMRDQAHLDELAEATHLLEALPLSTVEFVVASIRLNNARRYLDSGEHGAREIRRFNS